MIYHVYIIDYNCIYTQCTCWFYLLLHSNNYNNYCTTTDNKRQALKQRIQYTGYRCRAILLGMARLISKVLRRFFLMRAACFWCCNSWIDGATGWPGSQQTSFNNVQYLSSSHRVPLSKQSWESWTNEKEEKDPCRDIHYRDMSCWEKAVSCANCEPLPITFPYLLVAACQSS